MRINNFQLFLISIFLLLVFILMAESRAFIQAPIRIFTEGTTFGKHLVFLLYLVAIFAFKEIYSKKRRAIKRINSRKKNLEIALSVLIIGGFLFSLLLQLAIQMHYNVSNDSYLAHITNCGKAICWEATYLQHSHIPKTALAATENFIGMQFSSFVDTGIPMYQITPFAIYVAPLTLLIISLILILGILLSINEKNQFRLLFLFLLSITSSIAILDGGVFTVAGVTALTALFLYFLFEHKIIFDKLQTGPYLVAAIAILISNFGFWFLGTELYFRNWFVPPFLLITAFILFERKQKPLVFSEAAFLLFGVLFIIEMYSGIVGFEANAKKTLLVYGLPQEATPYNITFSNGDKLQVLEKYGWYALLSPSTAISAKEVEMNLRRDLRPPGYLFAEVDRNEYSERTIQIIWLSGSRTNDFDTYSFKPTSIVKAEDRVIITGISSLNGPHLALEMGSYLHSNGIDAIVVSRVI